jgi:hypothetical protein
MHRPQIVLGVLVIVLRSNRVAISDFRLGQRKIAVVVSPCILRGLGRLAALQPRRPGNLPRASSHPVGLHLSVRQRFALLLHASLSDHPMRRGWRKPRDVRSESLDAVDRALRQQQSSVDDCCGKPDSMAETVTHRPKVPKSTSLDMGNQPGIFNERPAGTRKTCLKGRLVPPIQSPRS